MRTSLTIISLLLLASCRQVIDVVNMKQLAPEIVQYAGKDSAWYDYMPEYAPYFCLKTRYAIVYHDPRMKLGFWRAIHPEPPHRVMLEAREDTLIIHRSFVWDGMSFGKTEAREMFPSLIHDALYYARQGGAPAPRREMDQAFLRACRAHGCTGKYTAYLSVRTFGGLFGKPPGAQPPRIELTSPSLPPAALEPDAD